jgi:biopolymer transport protein TolR
MSRAKKRHTAMAEINVVPYIDVMLVLLIIFMVTAPMIMQGVQVELPHANAKPVPPQDDKPLVVSLKADGTYYIELGTKEEALAAASLEDVADRVGKVLRVNPEKKIFVWGDRQAPYGDVVALMAALQGVGAESVGLVTDGQSPKTP